MIHNDHSLGSVRIFSDDELADLNRICSVAEKVFSLSRPTPGMPYRMAQVLNYTNVWLVPITEFEVYINTWCKYANEVEDEWFDRIKEECDQIEKEYPDPWIYKDINISEIPELEPRREEVYESFDDYDGFIEDDQNDQINSCDRDPRELFSGESIANEILGPWKNCKIGPLKYTYYPLGWFDGKDIFICLDLIAEKCLGNSALITKRSAKTLLHELAHAMMHNSECGPEVINRNPYLYWTEEAMANKIMLDYLYAYDKGFFKEALRLVRRQNGPYRCGELLFINNRD